MSYLSQTSIKLSICYENSGFRTIWSCHSQTANARGKNNVKCILKERFKKNVIFVYFQGIDRIVFRELLHSTFDIVTEEILMERIFCSWDKAHEGLPLRLEGWLVGLSIFLRGSPSERSVFCFRVYDLNSDGFITKDEMFTLLRNCLIKQPQDEDPDEGVKDLVEIVLKKFDLDKDGKVKNVNDFIRKCSLFKLILKYLTDFIRRLYAHRCCPTFANRSFWSMPSYRECCCIIFFYFTGLKFSL